MSGLIVSTRLIANHRARMWFFLFEVYDAFEMWCLSGCIVSVCFLPCLCLPSPTNQPTEHVVNSMALLPIASWQRFNISPQTQEFLRSIFRVDLWLLLRTNTNIHIFPWDILPLQVLEHVRWPRTQYYLPESVLLENNSNSHYFFWRDFASWKCFFYDRVSKVHRQHPSVDNTMQCDDQQLTN